MKLFFYLMIFCLSNNFSYANCVDLLKLQINQNSEFLFGEKAHSLQEYKKELLRYVLEDVTKQGVLSKKHSKSDKQLQSFINSKKVTNKFQRLLSLLREHTSNPELIKEWAFDLYMDILTEIYISGNSVEQAKLSSEERLSELIGVNVIEQRVKDAGFQGVEVLEHSLSSEEFGQVLLDKKLILDREFELDTHGSMVHILQVDFIVYILRKFNMNPTLASDLYRWMGSRKIYELENGETFDSLSSGWGGLFDSTESDITSPEEFYPILRAYFKWYIE